MKKNGLILTGGGARAAYQVGVLKAIASMYPDWSQPFRVLVGTSAGAINTTAIAGGGEIFRHNIDRLETIWSELHVDDIYRSDAFGMVRNLTRSARGLLTGKSEGMPVSLLDNRPLRKLLEKHINFEGIREAVQAGHIDAVGLNACGYRSGQNICFYDGKEGLEAWHLGQRAGCRTELRIEHVLASSAIPTLFPPVRIHREYFGDGVIRQMAHISPAIHLGADRLLVIGVSANRVSPPKRVKEDRVPGLSQVMEHVFNGMFLDSMDYDIDRLRLINQLLEAVPEDDPRRQEWGLKPIEVLEISPSEPIDEIAARYVDGLPTVLRHLAGHPSQGAGAGGSLASYLLFDARFCRDLIELGYQDAQTQSRQIARFFKAEPDVDIDA
ncbi:patatin-like phospholipase family protein [Marinobacteraceae bacterium S3BR75-40.1]